MPERRIAYRIETERLVIRAYQPSDVDMLADGIIASLDHLHPWMPWSMQEPVSREERIEKLRSFRARFDLDQDYILGIFNKQESELLGSTGLHPRVGPGASEIGYWVNAKHIRQGIATENVRALTRVGFECFGFDRIEIRCDPKNEPSLRIPRKLGYKHEATLKNRISDGDGNPRDSMVWTLFRDVYDDSDLKDFELKAFDAVGELIID